ncbi:MAG: hypothetical protein KAV99_01830 [Candidatus Latescibacteria bacterium]|nr:hypothetical protein [Candidatus Latescibacterota bacterium]
MKRLSVVVAAGLMVLVVPVLALTASISVDVYPLYVAKDGGAGTTGTPFAVFVRISGWTDQANQDAYIRIHEAVSVWSNYYHWTASGSWSRTATYSVNNYPILHIDGSGNAKGWIFLKSPSDKTFTTFTVRAHIGTSNLDLGVNKSITPMDMSTTGAWIWGSEAAGNPPDGYVVLACGAEGILGAYAAENNSINEDYESTSGYWKMAVPANTTITELKVKDPQNNLYATDDKNGVGWGNSGNPGNTTRLTDYSLPVTLTSFTATAGDGEVTLRWVTESEVNNLGFNIYRARREKKKDERGEPKEGEYEKINSELIPGAGTSTVRHSYCFTDKNVDNGTTYFYRLEDVSLDGKSTFHGPVEVVPRAEQKEQGEELPRQPRLEQNFPNPFNPKTSIRFAVPLLRGEPAIFLEIYNLSGQKVRTLLQQSINPGFYQLVWDSRNQNGAQVASGVYLCVLKIGGELIDTRKMALIR